MRAIVPFILFVLLWLGCANTPQKATLTQAVQLTIAATDTTYALTVELCDRKEKDIIKRPPTTLEADKADLMKIRSICDRIFGVFDQTRLLVPLASELEQIQ
jgi:hypothetical protein